MTTAKNKSEGKPFLSGYRALAAVFICLFVLVLVNTVIVFQEGWDFTGCPDSRLFQAQTRFHHTDSHMRALDSTLHPMFQLGGLFAWIGQATPPWYRLTGSFVLVIIFLLVYAIRPGPLSHSDRLTAACVVCTTPIVFYTSRLFEVHIFQILVLLAAVASLQHSSMGRDRRWFALFFLMPVFSLWITDTPTQWGVAMTSLPGMYLYTLWKRSGTRSLWSIFKQDLPLILLAIAALVVFALARFNQQQFDLFLNYYSSEAFEFDRIEHDGFQPLSWYRQILAYPQVLVFSASGLLLCLLAAGQILPRYRSKQVWLYLLWIIPPLLFFSYLQKKNTFYGWYMAPAISLMAADTVLRFNKWLKTAAIVLFMLLAVLHLRYWISPLEAWMDIEAFEMHNPDRLVAKVGLDENEIKSRAAEMNDLLLACANLDRRSLYILEYPARTQVQPYMFQMANLNAKPNYQVWGTHVKQFSVTDMVIELKNEVEPEPEPEKEIYLLPEIMGLMREVLPLTLENEKYRLYCRPSEVESEQPSR